MCHPSVLNFGLIALQPHEVAGKAVLEVGAKNVNGSLRGLVTAMGPSLYIGVDITPGPGVDQLCNVYDLSQRFGSEVFDLVITTEMMEHVPDWRLAILNMKQVLKPGGILILTTRSKGFPYHEYPGDYWRFELADMQHIFSDFRLEILQPDPQVPGVFVKAVKPPNHVPINLDNYQVHAMEPQ